MQQGDLLPMPLVSIATLALLASIISPAIVSPAVAIVLAILFDSLGVDLFFRNGLGLRDWRFGDCFAGDVLENIKENGSRGLTCMVEAAS